MLERGDDLLLVRYFLSRFSRELGREVHEVAPEALERLRDDVWPGNIQVLQSVLKQALLLASDAILLPAFLPESLEGSSEPASRLPPGGGPVQEAFTIRQRLGLDVRNLYVEAHRRLDRLLLPRVLVYTRGSQHRPALLLGIVWQTLRLKLRALGLPTRLAESEGDDPA